VILGWDIGGSNTKVCRVESGQVVTAVSRPFEVKDAPDRLAALLRALEVEVAAGAPVDAHAVTMTAELSRNFLTKREGVAFVLDAVRTAFAPPVPIFVFAVRGGLVPLGNVHLDAVAVASANWMATAILTAETCPDALLIDTGSTTTDIIPIVGGKVASLGHTDLERLATGELVYTGVLRTPVEGIAHDASVAGVSYGVAAEGFATSGDVYVCLGDLLPEAYAGPTADGRPPDRRFAEERLRRALCADREHMPVHAVHLFAKALAEAQVARIAAAIGRVRSRRPAIQRAVVAGLGAFVAARAARAAGLELDESADGRHSMASQCAPAAAVGILLERSLHGRQMAPERRRRPWQFERASIERVVKVGGGLLAHPRDLERVMDRMCKARRAIVVPGGGPFADAVRALDPRVAPSDARQHWMAVQAMDQYAEVLLGLLAHAGERVETLAEAQAALKAGRIPVLAPSRWLRHADPLPRSWDVTSDSIAAWIAGQASATTLALIKPPGATGQLTDAYFEAALPPGITCAIVAADDEAKLDAALGIPSPSEVGQMLERWMDE
jgi:probable H4MPT-linked C1 transfer pathway protein